MGASSQLIEPGSWLVRVGEYHERLGDKYEASVVVSSRGEITGLDNPLTVGMTRALKEELRKLGLRNAYFFRRVEWDLGIT